MIASKSKNITMPRAAEPNIFHKPYLRTLNSQLTINKRVSGVYHDLHKYFRADIYKIIDV